MPLQKQLVPIDFTGGLDNKTDAKLVLPGKLTTLENAVFQASNTVSKRTGFTAIPGLMLDGSALGTVLMEATFKDELLKVDTTGAISSYATHVAKWVPKGYVPLNTATSKPVIRNSAQQSAFDYGGAGNVTVFAWQDSRGGVRVSVFDDGSSTGASFLADYSLSATGTIPRVVVDSGSICVLYAEGANLRMRTLSTSAPTVWTAAVSLKTDMAVAPSLFDAVADQTGIWVAYKRASDSTLNVFCTNAAAGVVVASVNRADNPNGVVHINSYNSGARIAVIYARAAGAGPRCAVYSVALALVAAVDVVDPDAYGAPCVHISSVSSGATELILVYDYDTGVYAAGLGAVTVTATLSAAPAISLTGNVARGVEIASRPFTLNGDVCLAVVNNSTLQPTLFVVAIDGVLANKVVAKALVWRGGGFKADGIRAPHAFSTCIPVGERGRLAFNSGINITPVGITRLNIGGLTTSERVAVELNDNLLFAASAPSIYDGNAITEHGFHLYPEGATCVSGAGGTLADGSYQSIFVYEWTDARGSLHRSIPSPAITTTISGGGGVRRLQYIIPTLHLTSKTSPSAEVSIAIFRTAANGSVFFRSTSVAAPLFNAPAAITVSTNDTTPDAVLAGNEILYTTGDILERAPCPPCRIATVHQNRLAVAGLEGSDGVAYSLEAVPGEGLAFNEVLTHAPPDTGGAVTALASQDDKLLISKEDRWYYVAGEGPNDAGQQNGYTAPQLAAAETGCRLSCSRSVQVTDDGVLFQSSKGLRLLSRGLSIARDAAGRFMGSEVDGSLVNPVVASLLDRANDQVRFYVGITASNAVNVLVWDEHWRQWSKFTAHSASDAVRWGSYLVHGASGAPFQENAGFNDNGTAIQFKLESGWIALAGVQGLQRVYKLLLLGTFSASATLTLEVGLDYAAAYQTAVAVDMSGFAVGVPLQIEYRLPIQKCEAIRFRIIEAAGTSGFALSSFALLVGTKRGAFKLPATKVVG